MSYVDRYTSPTATKIQARELQPGDEIVPLRSSGPGFGVGPVYGVYRDGGVLIVCFGRPDSPDKPRTATHQVRNPKDELYIFRPRAGA